MTKKEQLKSIDYKIKLIKEAIKKGVKVQPNHRFTYKGVHLGSFLVDAKRRNKKDLIKRIEETGFLYNNHSLQPEEYVARFIKELWQSEKSEKGKFITRFNKYVLPKKNKLKKKTIEEVNVVWKLKYNEKRKWIKPVTTSERVDKWKGYRYNKYINPDGTWYGTRTQLYELYYWVYNNRRLHKMNLIWKYFSEKEQEELRKEGFN